MINNDKKYSILNAMLITLVSYGSILVTSSLMLLFNRRALLLHLPGLLYTFAITLIVMGGINLIPIKTIRKEALYYFLIPLSIISVTLYTLGVIATTHKINIFHFSNMHVFLWSVTLVSAFLLMTLTTGLLLLRDKMNRNIDYKFTISAALSFLTLVLLLIISILMNLNIIPIPITNSLAMTISVLVFGVLLAGLSIYCITKNISAINSMGSTSNRTTKQKKKKWKKNSEKKLKKELKKIKAKLKKTKKELKKTREKLKNWSSFNEIQIIKGNGVSSEIIEKAINYHQQNNNNGLINSGDEASELELTNNDSSFVDISDKVISNDNKPVSLNLSSTDLLP